MMDWRDAHRIDVPFPSSSPAHLRAPQRSRGCGRTSTISPSIGRHLRLSPSAAPSRRAPCSYSSTSAWMASVRAVDRCLPLQSRTLPHPLLDRCVAKSPCCSCSVPTSKARHPWGVFHIRAKPHSAKPSLAGVGVAAPSRCPESFDPGRRRRSGAAPSQDMRHGCTA